MKIARPIPANAGHHLGSFRGMLHRIAPGKVNPFVRGEPSDRQIEQQARGPK
jgi:hypothetical protein